MTDGVKRYSHCADTFIQISETNKGGVVTLAAKKSQI
jgi:hypothetical protein